MYDLVSKFVEQLPEQLAHLNQVAKQKNWKQLSQRIHDLKGLGGNFGFLVLSQVSKQIESEISSQAFSNIQPLLQELDSICERIKLGHNNQ